MRRTLIMCLSVALATTALMAQPQGGRRGPQMSWMPYFRYDKAIPDSATFMATVSKFRQLTYEDADTGLTLRYNLFVPRDYDPAQSYPLLLFMHDASVTGRETTATLTQGLGAVVWASDYEQQKHPCFVLAPQFDRAVVNDSSEATPDLDATVHLIRHLERLYSIDDNRLYTTGQSGGCMASIFLNSKYPDLFAASYLCSGQWAPELTDPLARMNLWITVAEGDTKAYPGMNAITDHLKELGATVARDYISATTGDAQLAFKVDEMLARHANVNYLVLTDVVPPQLLGRGGAMDHMCSWLTTYSIEGIRDWLFRQRKAGALASRLRDAKGTDVLLAADMGDWHGTAENSLRAIEKAAEKQAAIAAVDLRRTSDGVLVLCRDDSLSRLMSIDGDARVDHLTLQQLRRYAYKKTGADPYTDHRMPTLAETIAFAQGKILLLIKNATDYLPDIISTVKRLGAEGSVILGGMAEPMPTDGLMFIPAVDLDRPDALTSLQLLLAAGPVAVELRFADSSNALLPQALAITLPVCRVAFNIGEGHLAGSFRDITHDDDPADVFLPMLATGATIFTTEQVKPFSRYLQGKSGFDLWRP